MECLVHRSNVTHGVPGSQAMAAMGMDVVSPSWIRLVISSPHDQRSMFQEGLQVPSENVFGVGLEGLNTF